MEAAAKEWQSAADAMYEEHPHLKDYGDLMELVTRDEYTKDPKRAPKDLYGAVAKRADGMVRLQKGGPSLPESATGTVQVSQPSKESRNEMRLRQMREGRGGNK
jgi:hypothetical protein